MEKKPCPTWSQWVEWTECSAECGGGTRERSRTCQFSVEGRLNCEGNSVESEICNIKECPHWLPYGDWEPCSVSCGVGVQHRHRRCSHGTVDDHPCVGEDLDERPCGSKSNACAHWSEWTAWSLCDKSCDGGYKTQTRKCVNGEKGEDGCIGDDMKKATCNINPCPKWSEWSDWTLCSASCDGGESSRVRICEYGDIGQVGCEGSDIEVVECNAQKCARWSEWGEWTVCSASCGSGIRTHKRECLHGSVGQVGCEGPVSEDQICIIKQCSVWAQWQQWGECTKTCGGGARLRSRECRGGEIGEVGCENGGEIDTDDCNVQSCANCNPDYSSMEVQYGRVTCTNGNELGSICSFSCGRDYQLVGVETLICLPGSTGLGEWNSKQAPTCTPKCSDQADIVFVIDSSSSIRVPNFRIIRSFIRTVVDQFNVGPDAALFGAIRYNREVMHLWNLNEYENKDNLLEAVSNIPYDGSGTLTGKAINYTRVNMFTPEAGRRLGVPKIVVVITDGVSYDDVATPSFLLKSENTIVIAVGIGRVNQIQINEIATDPDENFATLVTDFGSLTKVVSTISKQIKLCQPIPEREECPPQAVMDLLFVVDSSSSIEQDNFNIVKKFIKDIVKTFNINKQSAQVGIIRYNKVIDEVLKLSDHDNADGILQAVDEMKYEGSGTKTGMALEYASTNALTAASGRRPGVKAVTIVLTDGLSTDGVASPSFDLQQKSVVIAVGIKGAAKQQLNTIATGEGPTNVFSVQEFEALNAILGNIAQAVCFASREGVISN